MVRHKESIISGLVLMADNSLGYSMTIGHYKQRKEEEMIFFLLHRAKFLVFFYIYI